MNSELAPDNSLSLFHPLVGQWFRERYGEPTDIQKRAWPVIADGGHALVTAPTGSGKTLTAFLWAVNSLLTKRSTKNLCRVLYISPLKALNNDIRRNLEEPLSGLRACFEAAGTPFPDITVSVRSGDTGPEERRAMLKRPPDIFITTPESLNILLSSKSGRRLLTGISTVILDEIHAVASVKRGAYLMTAVERLSAMYGEFQRISLSATVRPMETIADFVGGSEVRAGSDSYSYRKRPVTLIASSVRKQYDIRVSFPSDTVDPENEPDWWREVADSLRTYIDKNRSTLIFANSRRMVEKITRIVNDRAGENRVYSHHGSLSREIREVVEKRLKEGELAAIVATSSLELGIDIGSVDTVVLVQIPYSVSSAVQRIGRAGHGVGKVSRGVFHPVNPKELMEAAVIARAAADEDIETIRPVEKPLDVLGQIILSMTLIEEMRADEVFAVIRASYPYRDLTRREFDLVVDMLAGRYADTRIRELKPRLLHDRLDGSLKARDNVRSLIYLSGGVIPDRGYFNLRTADTKARIGELDEEFVWERSLGDAFPFGNMIWRIVRVTHNDVEVEAAGQSNSVTPFWRAEDMNRSYHLSERIGFFLEDADCLLASHKKKGRDILRDKLRDTCFMTDEAAGSLADWLARQKEATGVIPHRHAVVVEHFRDQANTGDSKQTIIHTLWGGPVNRPLALAMAAAWEERFGYPLEVFVNNDCIMLNLPHEFSAEDILSLAVPETIPRLLRSKLESTGFFGARFRENAQRSLLLSKRNFHERMPFWMNRLRSKKLLEAVSRFEDFPVLLETWRECIEREFDLDTLYSLLEELHRGDITVVEARTASPSPFTGTIVWRQTNYYMYVDDTPASKLKTNLSDSLLQEVVFSPHLRPRLPDALIREFEEKARRVAPGYAPGTPGELLQWLRERLFIPAGEWDELLRAIDRDHGLDGAETASASLDRIYTVARDDVAMGYTALENLPFVAKALDVAHDDAAVVRKRLALQRPMEEEPEGNGSEESEGKRETALTDFLGRWLAFYGPVSAAFIRGALGIDEDSLGEALETLVEDRAVVIDEFREPESSAGEEVCDAGNLEILLRMRRAAVRPAFEPLESADLPRCLSVLQGLCPSGQGLDDLEERLERLFGYPARAALWESDILPARLEPYYSEWLDTAMRDSDLMWFGCGRERLAFAFEPDMDLYPPDETGGDGEPVRNGSARVDNGAYTDDGGEGNIDGVMDTGGRSPDESQKLILDIERFLSDAGAKRRLKSGGKLSGGHAPSHAGDNEGLLFHSAPGADLDALMGALKQPADAISDSLWELAWRGHITNDGFEAVRRGIMNRFRVEKTSESALQSRGRRRIGFARWKNTRPFAGTWRAVEYGDTVGRDALDEQEIEKDRVRQLLLRYGVLFRELVANELPALRWGRLFRTLRLMELSGEVFAGYFFKDIPGLQFSSREALRILGSPLPADTIFWMNACDPASLCGIGVDALRGGLPPRLPTTHLVYHDRNLVLVSRRNGGELKFTVGSDNSRIAEYLAFFRTLLGRRFQPLKHVETETINGVSAVESPYRAALTDFGFVREYKSLVLRKRF